MPSPPSYEWVIESYSVSFRFANKVVKREEYFAGMNIEKAMN